MADPIRIPLASTSKATLTFQELMQHVFTTPPPHELIPAPVAPTVGVKAARDLRHAEPTARLIMGRLMRGATRGEIETLCNSRLNLARVARVYGMVVHMGVTERGTLYQATPPDAVPTCFDRTTITMVL